MLLLFKELRHYVEEYVHVYDTEDDDEWGLVMSEVTTFVEVRKFFALMVLKLFTIEWSFFYK